MRLEFGEGHFDRVKVRAVGRQEEKPCPLGSDRCLGSRAFVGSEIVEDADIALCQRRSELRFDVCFEDAPVHRRVDDERSGEPMTTQPGNEGLRPPMPERCLGAQPLALQAAATQAGHLRGGSGFIYEHQSVRLKLHPRLALGLPLPPRLADVGTILLAGQQRFF